jgi:hypothetical protein
MSCCADMKQDQVWRCDSCGLEVRIAKECDCTHEGSPETACSPTACLTCCDKPLKLKK